MKGVRGEKIDFPEVKHPLNGEFKGWYIDADLTIPYTSTTFDKSEMNVYAKWRAYSGFVQDFENYTKDRWTPKKEVMNNGTPNDKTDDYECTKKSNYLYFWPTMSKQSDVTHSGDYAIKFHWNTDPSLHQDDSKKDGQNINNPESYNQNRYKSTDNYFNIGTGLENNQLYTITFKYKVEKGNQNVQFYLLTADDHNGWGSRVPYYMPETVDLKPDDEWQEYTYEFVTAMQKPNQSLYLGVKLSEHKDVIMYFDDILVKSVVDNEECILFLNNGYEPTLMRHFGVKGEKLNIPVLDHPDGAEFIGWYTDAALTTPFDSEVYPNNNTTLYAKWKACPITFKNYPFEGHPYADSFFKRETAKGLGNGDDHAMHWKLKRVKPNTTGEGTPNAFMIYNGLEDGAVYRIKYDYKVNPANNKGGTLAVVSNDYYNVWRTNIKTKYQATEVKIPKGGTNGWETVEAYITAKVLATDNGVTLSKALYLQFVIPENTNKAGTDMDVLIDNVLVEKIEAPYVSFDGQNNKSCAVSKGEEGEEIIIPADPKRIGYDFKGWYFEPECITPFNLKTFGADTELTVYAKWAKATTATYSFEDYTIGENNISVLLDAKLSNRMAKTGKNSIRFGDRTSGNYSPRSFFVFEDSGEYFELEYNRQYMITMNYYIKEMAPSSMNISFIASAKGNFWNGIVDNKGVISGTQTISYELAREQKGKWASMSFAIDTTGLEDVNATQARDALYVLITGGENWEIYFDDVTITQIPKGKSLVVLDTQGVKVSNNYFIGSVGASYANKLPETINKEGKAFKGYFSKSASGAFSALEREKMVFGEKATVIYARFINYEVSENFDNGFYDLAYGEGLAYSIHDFDYEVYDSEKLGNSKENVTSGRYSLHRKGNTMFNENSVILTLGNQIAESERYTVTFKVKMGKHLHTEGAIKIASSSNFKYAWDTTGDYHPVVAIADLTDGEWHEITYTFNSTEAFVSLNTPGYVELFVDDFKFTLVDKNTPVSTPVSFTEYVPAERDADGNLLSIDKTAVDISSIIDESLNSSSLPWLWIIIGAVVLLVIAGGVTAILIIKKKKSKA